MLDVEAVDAMISFTLNIDSARSAGLFWRNNQVNRKGLGTVESAVGLIINRESEMNSPAGSSTISIVNVECPKQFNSTTILCHLKDDYHQRNIAKGAQHVRILVRAHKAEVYINEQWIFCIDISDAPEGGNIGMLVESGKATITHLRVAEINPLEIAKVGE